MGKYRDLKGFGANCDGWTTGLEHLQNYGSVGYSKDAVVGTKCGIRKDNR